jgi:hypothetical protein
MCTCTPRGLDASSAARAKERYAPPRVKAHSLILGMALGLCDLSRAFHHCSKDLRRVRAGVLVLWHSETAALSRHREEREYGVSGKGAAMAGEVWRWRDTAGDKRVPGKTRKREKRRLEVAYGTRLRTWTRQMLRYGERTLSWRIREPVRDRGAKMRRMSHY